MEGVEVIEARCRFQRLPCNVTTTTCTHLPTATAAWRRWRQNDLPTVLQIPAVAFKRPLERYVFAFFWFVLHVACKNWNAWDGLCGWFGLRVALGH